MQFVKMHGAGNDYVYVDGFDTPLPERPEELALAISDRHTGVGSDGLILVEPSELADARMRIYNADGSRAEMCGNGLRCVAKLLYDRGHTHGERLRIETDAGLRETVVEVANGQVRRVRVTMGRPVLAAAEIPVDIHGGSPVVDRLLSVDGREFRVTCVSMGNPHCVVFVEQLSDALVTGVGPVLERHAAFPRRTNVEFVQVFSRLEVEVCVWERGVGETQACGSGACAVAVAGVLTGRTDRSLSCHLPGGRLDVEWREDQDVHLTGPAVEVFRGEWPDNVAFGERREQVP
jgi:diaminopimelate epimerase